MIEKHSHRTNKRTDTFDLDRHGRTEEQGLSLTFKERKDVADLERERARRERERERGERERER